jgi:hypothetical protein
LPDDLATLSDAQLLQLAGKYSPHPDRVVSIVVRELGPILEIGLPVIVKGGTDVAIEVRVLDTAAETTIVDAHTHWRNAGAFVVKGVKTLDHDMNEALSATLMSRDANRLPHRK